MEENTYHFEGLRLNASPQTRVHSQSNTPGFPNLAECIKFCHETGFDYTIYYYPKGGKKKKVYPTD